MGSNEVVAMLLALAAILATTRFFGEITRRLGQPGVIGELLAGVLLGPPWPLA